MRAAITFVVSSPEFQKGGAAYAGTPKPRSDSAIGGGDDGGQARSSGGDWGGGDDGGRLSRRWTISAGDGGGSGGGGSNAKVHDSPSRNSLIMTSSNSNPNRSLESSPRHSPFGTPLGGRRNQQAEPYQPYQPYGSSALNTSYSSGAGAGASAGAGTVPTVVPPSEGGGTDAGGVSMVGGKGSTATVEDMGGFLSKLALGF